MSDREKCGGLNENCLLRLMYLNMWSLVIGTFGGNSSDRLAEEVCHWKVTFENV